MKTNCPRDEHDRHLDVGAKRLECSVKGCPCGECHKAMTEREMKEWAPPDK